MPARAGVEEGTAAYEKGDFATAYSEFFAAAERGNARAKLSLGLLFLRGQGVDRDVKQAARWLREAAGQGEGEARVVLGDVYMRDDPDIQDFVKSYVWLTLSLRKVRGPLRATALRLRADVTGRMSPDQVARAKTLLEQWNALDR